MPRRFTNLPLLSVALCFLLSACGAPEAAPKASAMDGTLKTAVFAGGCFWCMQSEFDGEPGVVKTMAGFTGGHVKNPTYEQVASGTTGHREALEVTYDPKVTTYAHLLSIFWDNIDPLDALGQFCDKGDQYKAAIFVSDEADKADAEASAAAVSDKLGRAVVTDILPRAPFYPAEAYHQEYYKTSASAYQRYRQSCGRDGRLNDLKKAMQVNP